MTTHCWRCERAIDDADRYCRACGEGQGAFLAWYYRPLWIVLLALTVLGPFAIVLIMRTPRLGTAAKWFASLALIALSVWVGARLWRDTRVYFDLDVRQAAVDSSRSA